jgi:branched-chain amino acid transport system permease protein
MRCSALRATAWAVAFGCAALAAVVYVERAPVVLSMSDVGLSAFPAAVIGGMDNVGGAFVGATVVALVESFTALFLGGAAANALSYALMLAVLVVLPYGLLGRRPSVRL